MEDENEQPFYDRKKVELFLREPKKLQRAALRLRPTNQAVHIPVVSTVEPRAVLTIWVRVDGDFRIGVGISERPSVVFCRYDRVPHARPVFCEETSKEITGGHKHYFARNVHGPQKRVSRPPKDIPTAIPAAVKAFCKEVGIDPPKKVHVQTDSGLGDFQ